MSLFNSSVASITASLGRMVAKLEAHAAQQRAKGAQHSETAGKYVQWAYSAEVEASQADRVREKLASILD